MTELTEEKIAEVIFWLKENPVIIFFAILVILVCGAGISCMISNSLSKI